jgi:MFS family permease
MIRIAREALAVNSALFLGMAFLMLGAGLQSTLLGVRATLEGFSTFVTGAVMTGYYVGYIAGSLAAPSLVRRVGHIRVFAALTATAAAAILVQSILVGPWAWALLRCISGVAFDGIYVVAESWLNDRAERHSRGALLASYMIVIYVGLGAGQFLLNAADPRGDELFVLIGVLISIAVVPMALTAQRAPEFALPHRVTLREVLHVSPLGTVGAFISGFATATFFAVGPVYAARSGLDASDVAMFMACGILPAIVLQLPLGRLSDRLDRRSVLMAMAVSAAAAGFLALQTRSGSLPVFFAAVGLYGGLSLTMYALCASHVNDHLKPEQMVAASATVLLVNGAGAVLGPIVVSAAMELTSPSAFFACVIAMHSAFALYAGWRKRRTDPIPDAAKIRFVGAPPQVAPTGRLVAAEAEPEALPRLRD